MRGKDRGQASIELIALLGVIAALAGVVAVAMQTDAAGAAVSALRRAIPTAPRRYGDAWALQNPRYRALARHYAPRLVLERDRWGEDASVPVDPRVCRDRRCARNGVGRPTAFVHVDRRDGLVYLVYWLYYPDSRTAHLPIDELRGDHDDDWEGIIVRVSPDGAAIRVSAHTGWSGSSPWWEGVSWAATGYRPTVYRASGSHANGLGPRDIDLAGDRWNGDLGTVDEFDLLPADELPHARLRYSPEARPPWMKAVWRDPEVAGTGSQGGPGGHDATARRWSVVVEAARIVDRSRSRPSS